MAHIIDAHVDYDNWHNSIRNDTRHCVQCVHPYVDNIIVVYGADGKLIGYWNCLTDYGEIYLCM